MSEWETIGQSDEWYTPPEIFEAIGLDFDLDPCWPDTGRAHTPCYKVWTKSQDGLLQPWKGRVWMNPPFGARNGQVPWLKKFIAHGNGIALVPARTSAGWFHDLIPKCDAILFPKGKTKFHRPDGSIGKSPGTGVVLIAMGETCVNALKRSGLGIAVDLRTDKSKVA